jgi:hypothetical protein
MVFEIANCNGFGTIRTTISYAVRSTELAKYVNIIGYEKFPGNLQIQSLGHTQTLPVVPRRDAESATCLPSAWPDCTKGPRP